MPTTSAIRMSRVSLFGMPSPQSARPKPLVQSASSACAAADAVARAPLMAADNPSAMGILEFGRAVLHDEARALDALADDLGASFEQAIQLICNCKGKLLVCGLGKSGHVGRKIA